MSRLMAQTLVSLVIFSVIITILLFSPSARAAAPKNEVKIPVIYDSDIGDDIDDTWALVMLLKSPEFDVKLVVGDFRKATYRAKLFAKLLTVAGRTDIPVGMAFGGKDGGGRQSLWVDDYDLSTYKGKIYEDGVQAIIDTIMNSKEKITVIAVGPLTNIAEALRRQPQIAEKARFVGMHGSVRLGYGGSKTIHAEYNVKADAKSCQTTLSAPWDITITPLDTCGLIHLRGEKYAKIRNSQDPLTKALLENYRIWRLDNKPGEIRTDETASSTLFDTVAIYLAFSHNLVQIEELPIRVTDDGFTRIDETGKKMKVATAWKDMAAFEDLLVERILAPVVKP
ncbi:MAG: nucleoside hydrolase [Phycisphaerae bacterium]|nr:nucleoside hydrolase [Phycisphaerae bacterium]